MFLLPTHCPQRSYKYTTHTTTSCGSSVLTSDMEDVGKGIRPRIIKMANRIAAILTSSAKHRMTEAATQAIVELLRLFVPFDL